MSQSFQGLRPLPDGKPWLVLADKEFHDIAKDMIERSIPGSMEAAWVEWKVFPDGTPNIRFDANSIEGRDVIFIGSVERHLLPFMSLCYAVPRCLARTFTVVVPFYPTGTMERVETEGEVATAKTLARMMSATPSPQLGETTFIFFEMHALATRFYFSDNIKVQLHTAVPLFLRHLDKLTKREGAKPMIAFPDEGAKKRFGRFFRDKFEICLCIKTRIGDKRELVLQEGAPAGQHVFIVDDLVQSGGTLVAARDLLYAKGASKVSAYVTHGVFPRESWKRFLVENTPKGLKPFESFIMTDSIPHSARAVEGKRPFKVLSLADRLMQLMAPTGVLPAKM